MKCKTFFPGRKSESHEVFSLQPRSQDPLSSLREEERGPWERGCPVFSPFAKSFEDAFHWAYSRIRMRNIIWMPVFYQKLKHLY